MKKKLMSLALLLVVKITSFAQDGNAEYAEKKHSKEVL